MARRARVDAELVRRGLARSRQQAAELIGAGLVTIDGIPAAKPATAISLDARLVVRIRHSVVDGLIARADRGLDRLTCREHATDIGIREVFDR